MACHAGTFMFDRGLKYAYNEMRSNELYEDHFLPLDGKVVTFVKHRKTAIMQTIRGYKHAKVNFDLREA